MTEDELHQSDYFGFCLEKIVLSHVELDETLHPPSSAQHKPLHACQAGIFLKTPLALAQGRYRPQAYWFSLVLLVGERWAPFVVLVEALSSLIFCSSYFCKFLNRCQVGGKKNWYRAELFFYVRWYKNACNLNLFIQRIFVKCPFFFKKKRKQKKK